MVAFPEPPPYRFKLKGRTRAKKPVTKFYYTREAAEAMRRTLVNAELTELRVPDAAIRTMQGRPV